MGMALKKDVAAACRLAGVEKPVDLVHLSSMTMGDRTLEMEILSMFETQIPGYIRTARDCCSEAEVRRAAHTIKGAARGIGAFRLAEFAQNWENSGEFEFEVLQNELTTIKRYISSLI